jgi:hypothetical protein
MYGKTVCGVGELMGAFDQLGTRFINREHVRRASK